MTRNTSRRSRLDRLVDEQVGIVFAAIGFVMLLILAGLSPSPEIRVMLQAGGVGGAFGVLVAYLRHRDDPEADRWRTVTGFSLLGLAGGLLLVLGELLLSS
jgi:hypothetical protein